VRSITLDGGPENTCHLEVTKEQEFPYSLRTPITHGRKERGEHNRESETILSQGYFITCCVGCNNTVVENKINNTPRKCLGWATPNEMMMKEVNKYKFRKYLKTLEVKAGGALQIRM